MKVAGRLFFLLVLLTGVSLGAQTVRKPFSVEELNRFIDDWPGVVSWAEAEGYPFTPEEKPGEYLERVSKAGLPEYLNTLGWNMDSFSYIAGNAAAALLIIRTEESLPDFSVQLKKQRSEVRNNSTLTSAQKQELVAELDDLLSGLQGYHIEYEIPASELSLVRERKTDILRIFRQAK